MNSNSTDKTQPHLNDNDEKSTLVSTLKRFVATGIEVPSCVLSLDLLRDDKLEAYWDLIEGHAQRFWRARIGSENRRFRAPNDVIAALFILFLRGELIVKVFEEPQP